MSNGMSLFVSGFTEYQSRGNPASALNYYTLSLKKIIRDEIITAPLPSFIGLPAEIKHNFPEQALGVVWANFTAILKESNSATYASEDSLKLLESFRPGKSGEKFKRFERTEDGKKLLKAMQITAGFTLGLRAWDAKDRVSTAKRYKEALELASTHAPFDNLSSSRTGLDRFVATNVAEMKDNYAILVENDSWNAALAGKVGAERKESVNVANGRMDSNGNLTREESFVLATNVCGECGRRDLEVRRCTRCKKIAYCGAECQKKHWPAHKANCVKTS